MLLAVASATALIIAYNLTHTNGLPELIVVKVQGKVLHRVDSRLFGQFMERPDWYDETGSSAALIPRTKDVR